MAEKQRVLVVDETPANSKVLNDLLQGEYNISIAAN